MFKRYLKIFTSVGLLALCIGCSQKSIYQNETDLDKNWGRSYEAAKYNQILNPDAVKNRDPVDGLDGRATDNNVEKYRNSFKEIRSQETVNIFKLQ